MPRVINAYYFCGDPRFVEACCGEFAGDVLASKLVRNQTWVFLGAVCLCIAKGRFISGCGFHLRGYVGLPFHSRVDI